MEFDDEFNEDLDEELEEDFDEPASKSPTDDFRTKTPEHKTSSEGKKISVFFLNLEYYLDSFQFY